MRNILEKIVAKKLSEVALLKNKNPNLEKETPPRAPYPAKSLKTALKKDGLSIIAEIKRKSPTRGKLALIANPAALAKAYIDGGADAISTLTDKDFFGGSIEDMKEVAAALKNLACPVLRKDFIIDKIQISESVAAGADAILLITAVLGKKIKDFLDIAKKMNIEALVEVQTKEELAIAINCGAEIIGINNRDLNTFQVDINRSLELVHLAPKETIKVAESGVSSPESAIKLELAGFDAILVGEALVRAKDPALLIKKLKGDL